MTVATDDALGPVDLLVIGFPAEAPRAGGFRQLTELVDAGTVRVLDLEFVRRSPGGIEVVEVTDLPEIEEFDSDYWTGASSHLLGSDDLEALAGELHDGELAVVLLIEQQWLAGLVQDWTSSGARLIAEGGVSPQDLIDALDAVEQSEEEL